MKFVHLTKLKNIGRIKKEGIHKIKGKGVYCMPFLKHTFLAYVENPKDPEGLDNIIKSNDPLPAYHLWRFLFNYGIHSDWGIKHAAIIFDMPKESYPLRITFPIGMNGIANEVALILKDDPILNIPEEEKEEYIRISEQPPFFSDTVDIKVYSEEAASRVFHILLESGYEVPYKSWEYLEVITSSSIPVSAIKRIIPFYRKSHENKNKKYKDYSKEE